MIDEVLLRVGAIGANPNCEVTLTFLSGSFAVGQLYGRIPAEAVTAFREMVFVHFGDPVEEWGGADKAGEARASWKISVFKFRKPSTSKEA